MIVGSKIVTVGLCPCWDTVCRLEGVNWGRHSVVSSRTDRPAGKALNISRALAWMGQKSIAAGLWGRQDYEQMLKALGPLRKPVRIEFTAVKGATRQNITIVDTGRNREMHLRNRSELASRRTLGELKADLQGIVNKNSVCVFAGSMPDGQFLGDAVHIINNCSKTGAKVALDTSGPALKKLVDRGGLWLVKPNVAELSELLGRQVKDTVTVLVKAGRELLEQVEIVLISRGEKGAIIVTKEGAWQGRCVVNRRKVLSTVGCGDYLLAGFLKGLAGKKRSEREVGFALQTAIAAATAKAWGLTEQISWAEAKHKIKTDIQRDL